MSASNISSKSVGAGLFAAILASLCCITPVFSLLAGVSGMAATFSWMEPFRPYLIGLTILVLGFAWYLKLRPIKEVDCECETDKKPMFIQSKLFLGLITGIAILMLTFPFYGSTFYPNHEQSFILGDEETVSSISLEIKGMTCTSCEEHVNHTVNQLDGIVSINSSFIDGNANIEYDASRISMEEIEDAVNSTGYTVTSKTAK